MGPSGHKLNSGFSKNNIIASSKCVNMCTAATTVTHVSVNSDALPEKPLNDLEWGGI